MQYDRVNTTGARLQRSFFWKLKKSRFFEYGSFILIILDAVWVGFEIDWNRHPHGEKLSLQPIDIDIPESVFQFGDVVIALFFFLELLIRILSYRHVKEFALKQSPWHIKRWNLFDLTIVTVMITGSAIQDANLRRVSVLRLVRIYRVKIMYRWVPEMRLFFRSLSGAIHSVFVVFLWSIIIMYVFAIILTWWMKRDYGSAGKCFGDEVLSPWRLVGENQICSNLHVGNEKHELSRADSAFQCGVLADADRSCGDFIQFAQITGRCYCSQGCTMAHNPRGYSIYTKAAANITINAEPEVAAAASWPIQRRICFQDYFGSINKSFLALLQLILLDRPFIEIVRPVFEERLYGIGALLLLYIFLLSFTIVSMLVGMVVDNVQRIDERDMEKNRSRQLLDILNSVDKKDNGIHRYSFEDPFVYRDLVHQLGIDEETINFVFERTGVDKDDAIEKTSFRDLVMQVVKPPNPLDLVKLEESVEEIPDLLDMPKSSVAVLEEEVMRYGEPSFIEKIRRKRLAEQQGTKTGQAITRSLERWQRAEKRMAGLTAFGDKLKRYYDSAGKLTDRQIVRDKPSASAKNKDPWRDRSAHQALLHWNEAQLSPQPPHWPKQPLNSPVVSRAGLVKGLVRSAPTATASRAASLRGLAPCLRRLVGELHALRAETGKVGLQYVGGSDLEERESHLYEHVEKRSLDELIIEALEDVDFALKGCWSRDGDAQDLDILDNERIALPSAASATMSVVESLGYQGVDVDDLIAERREELTSLTPKRTFFDAPSQETAVLVFAVVNIDYDGLVSDEAMLSIFKSKVREAIAVEAGAGIQAPQVRLELEELDSSSLRLTARIITAEVSALGKSPIEILSAKLKESIESVLGIERVIMGAIMVKCTHARISATRQEARQSLTTESLHLHEAESSAEQAFQRRISRLLQRDEAPPSADPTQPRFVGRGPSMDAESVPSVINSIPDDESMMGNMGKLEEVDRVDRGVTEFNRYEDTYDVAPAYQDSALVEYYNVAGDQWVTARIRLGFAKIEEEGAQSRLIYSVQLGRLNQSVLHEDVPLERLREPLKQGEPVEVFSLRGGGCWLAAFTAEDPGETLVGYNIQLGFGGQILRRIPPERIRRRFLAGTSVVVYRGAEFGWCPALVHSSSSDGCRNRGLRLKEVPQQLPGKSTSSSPELWTLVPICEEGSIGNEELVPSYMLRVVDLPERAQAIVLANAERERLRSEAFDKLPAKSLHTRLLQASEVAGDLPLSSDSSESGNAEAEASEGISGPFAESPHRPERASSESGDVWGDNPSSSYEILPDQGSDLIPPSLRKHQARMHDQQPPQDSGPTLNVPTRASERRAPPALSLDSPSPSASLSDYSLSTPLSRLVSPTPENRTPSQKLTRLSEDVEEAEIEATFSNELTMQEIARRSQSFMSFTDTETGEFSMDVVDEDSTMRHLSWVTVDSEMAEFEGASDDMYSGEFPVPVSRIWFTDPRPNKRPPLSCVRAFYASETMGQVDAVCQAHFLRNSFDVTEAFHMALPCLPDQRFSFRNAEAAYFAVLHWEHAIEFQELSGKQAKDLSQQYYNGEDDPTYAGFGSRWNAMKMILKQKFARGTYMAKCLLSTEDDLLLAHDHRKGTTEGFWSDKYDGNGKNYLGLLLMMRRDKLAKREKNPDSWTRSMVPKLRLSRGEAAESDRLESDDVGEPISLPFVDNNWKVAVQAANRALRVALKQAATAQP